METLPCGVLFSQIFKIFINFVLFTSPDINSKSTQGFFFSVKAIFTTFAKEEKNHLWEATLSLPALGYFL